MTKVLFTLSSFFFFFNDTATTEIYTLSLHDALPISKLCAAGFDAYIEKPISVRDFPDRKSTRLNSSHDQISYAVFCLKKKKTNTHSQEYMTHMTLTHSEAVS